MALSELAVLLVFAMVCMDPDGPLAALVARIAKCINERAVKVVVVVIQT